MYINILIYCCICMSKRQSSKRYDYIISQRMIITAIIIICIYMYIYICIHVYMCVYIYMYTYIHTYIDIHIYTYAFEKITRQLTYTKFGQSNTHF